MKKVSILYLLLILIYNYGFSQTSSNVDCPWISQNVCNDGLWTLCGHTSSEMVMAKYENRVPLNSNVLSYNEMIRNWRGQSPLSSCSGSGTPDPNHLLWLFSQYGYTGKWYGTSSSNYSNNTGELSVQDLIDFLNKDIPVIVQVHTGMNTTSGTHWMVLREIADNPGTNNDYVKLNDPGTSYATTGTNRQFTLQQFLNSWQSSACDKIAIVIDKKNVINQSLSIYGGTKSNPKILDLYFDNVLLNSASSYSIPYLEIKCPNGDIISVSSSDINITQQRTIQGVVWNHFTVNLNGYSNNSCIPSNGYGCDLNFDVLPSNQASTIPFSGTKQLFFLDPNDLSDIGSTDDKWYDAYVKEGVRNGLFRGITPSSTSVASSFSPGTFLTRAQAATVIVNTAVRLGLFNIDVTGTTFSDVNSSNPYFKWIQTLRNRGIAAPNANFNPNANIDLGGFCKWINLTFGITSSTFNQSYHNSTEPKLVFQYPNNLDLEDAINTLYKMHDIFESENFPGFYSTRPINNAFDFSTTSSLLTSTFYVQGTNPISRASMARMMTLIYNWKKSQVPFTQGNSNGNSNPSQIPTSQSLPSLSDFVAYGEKYDNLLTPVGNVPAMPVQQTYSCASGGSLTIEYNSNYEGGNPKHHYWSMKKDGASLISNDVNHRSVTFTAPIVTTATSWKLYTYAATNKGKIKETYITINVNPTNANIPAPTWIQINNYSTNGMEIEWDGVGYGISNYEVQYSQDPTFTNGVVSHVENSLALTMFWTVGGLQGGVYYARVKSINSTGVSSNWSQTATFTLSVNTFPIISSVTPVSGSVIQGTSATLSFGAFSGNAPITYTLYFSTFNPLGGAPIATSISSSTYTVSNLMSNQNYYWVVKAVDMDGDEFTSGVYWFQVAPELIPPTGSISIENGAATTNSVSVNLNISAVDAQGTITGMRFSNDGISWPTYFEAYNVNRPAWNLVSYGGTSQPGVKTVYAQFIDNSGNISTSYTDNITLIPGVKGVFMVRNKKFESLRAANDYAVFGDTIYATSGYYDLSNEINPSSYLPYTNGVGGALKNGVSLLGEGADKTTLFWDGMNGMLGGLACAGNNLIQGLTLTVSVNPSYSRATLLLHGASNVTIKNCIIKNGYHAIEGLNYSSTGNPSNIQILNNLIYSNGSRSIHIRNCNHLTIENNTIDNGGYGTIYLLYDTNVIFKNNIVANSKAEAISISPSTSVTFTNNNVYNNRFSSTSPEENYSTSSGYLLDQTWMNYNISSDPLYVNSSSGNFQLTSSSPCLNTGVNVGLPFNSIAPEMGCYESGGTAALTLSSNLNANFILTKPDGTQQSYNSGQTISNLPIGMYGIYPEVKVNYYTPKSKFLFLDVNTTTNYVANYILDTQGPDASIFINGDNYTTQTPYVTIFCDVKDEVNGLTNGQMRFSNDGLTWSAAESISNKKLNWDLSSGSNLTAGTKVVYAKFSDKNGFWSGVVTDTINYTPNAKISIIQPAATGNVLRNAILAASEGDILLLENGNHNLGGGTMNFPIGVTLQGKNKELSIVDQTSALNLNAGFKLDNLTMTNIYTQNIYSSPTSNGLRSVVSNIISNNQSFQFGSYNKVILANNVFKNISSSYMGLVQFLQNSYPRSFLAINNVFDASVNNASLTTEMGLNMTSMCCGAISEIKNNIFIGFDVGTTNTAGGIRYTNSSSIVGDLVVSNNNFYNCVYKIGKINGVDISKDEYTYTVDPVFNSNYNLSSSSPLLHSGNTDLLYRNHDGTNNTIGINGGVYENTPPSVSLSSQQIGANQLKLIASGIDNQTPSTYLQYRWDYNNDGVMDSPFMLNNETLLTVTNPLDTIVCYVFDEHFAIGYSKIITPVLQLPSLNITVLDTNSCAGVNFDITASSLGYFGSNCNFDILLSNSQGDFATPSVIQSVPTQPNGLINFNLPNTLVSSNGYKLKIISSNPQIESNIINLNIQSVPLSSVSISPNSQVTICPNDTLIIHATPVQGGFSPNYQWKLNGLNVGSNSDSYAASSLHTGDVIWVELYSNATCASGMVSVSAQTNITTFEFPEPYIQNIDNTLAASTDVGVQWYRNGQVISGATSQFYEASQSGFYQIKVLQFGCSAFSPIFPFTYHPPAPIGDTSQLVCNNATIASLIAIGTSIKWYDSELSSTPLNSSYTLSNGQYYYATQTIGGIESLQRLTVRVLFKPIPIIQVSLNPSNGIICSGGQVVLTGNGLVTYSWNGGVLNGVPFTPNATSTYTVIGTDANGCSVTSTSIINVTNCGTCPSNITINTTPYNTAVTESGTWIQTSGTVLVPVGANVRLDANLGIGHVTLNPGFKAEFGAVFVAQAFNGCANGSPLMPGIKSAQDNTMNAIDDAKGELILYPNPTSGMITLVHPSTVTSIQVFDMVGKLVMNVPVENTEKTDINLSEFSNGIYHVRTQGFTTIKVIKQ